MTASFFWILAASLFATTTTHGAWGVAYAPHDLDRPRPAIVYLHGMWASPGYFARGSIPFGFLVCPRGNAPLGEGRMWAGSYRSVAPSVHAALRAAEALAPGKLDGSGDGTLVGYSNGAYFAVEVALAEPGKWSGLVLLSMKLDLDPARLRAAGIERVVFAAGERDAARASMQRLAQTMAAGGLESRFISLGPVGHEFPRDMETRMCAAIAWVRRGDVGACGGA
jgi:predicted esterase